MTQTELIERLRLLGIDVSPRALTDWSQKGLLPPLQQHGLGQGKGSRQVWDQDVVDQVIATHSLLARYARADEALLGLWLSGYDVSTLSARSAWIGHLERIRDRGRASREGL